MVGGRLFISILMSILMSIFMTLLLTISAATHAMEKCTDRSEFTPALCPFRLPEVRKIVVNQHPTTSPLATKSDLACKHFIPTNRTVRRFLSSAKKVTADDANQILDWSPCSANGEVYFVNGAKGHWKIDRYGGGNIVIDDKERIFLYCPSCNFFLLQ